MNLPTGQALVAGVVGLPIRHSLSPVLHNAWIRALGLDALYAPFAPPDESFDRFAKGFRGGAIRGLNVTAPFKERALALADEADATAREAGSANLLLFHEDGVIEARSTDGYGVIQAFKEQAPELDLSQRPVVILGAGGAARASIGALLDAGVPEIRVVNRTAARAEELTFVFKTRISAYGLGDTEKAFADAGALINAAAGGPVPPIDSLPEGAAVMDMTYRPLETGLLKAAKARGLAAVDGLAMLIWQARPSFEAFYGQPAPESLDVRAIAIAAVEAQAAAG
jgi:shikimate dehydrogenase